METVINMNMRDVLEYLEFAVFEFVLVPQDAVVFPGFKGNVFRGALGKTLRNLTCAFKDKECRDCLIRDKCIYARIFESLHVESESILHKVENAPHPFVLYIPEKYDLQYPVNSNIRFFLVLVGEAIEYISYFILAFEEIGKQGIGKTRTGFKLEQVSGSGKSMYNPLEKKINRDFPIFSGRRFLEPGPKPEVQAVTISMDNFWKKYDTTGELGIDVFTMLFVTTSPQRMENIRRKLFELPEECQEYYLFNTFDRVKEDFFNRQWKIRSKDDNREYEVI